MSVIQDLKNLGGEPIGDTFNQDAFRGAIEVGGVDLTGGYCSGVVLDWARRVLQSAADRDPKYMSYSQPGTGDKRRATVKRMVEAYVGHAPTYVGGEANANKIAAKKILEKLKGCAEKTDPDYGTGVLVSNAEAKLFAKLWKVPGRDGFLFEKFDLNMEPAGALPHSDIRDLEELLDSKVDPQHEAHSADGRHWQTLSRPSTVYGTAGQWASQLSNHAFRPNCCTIVTFNPSAGGDGHAVAVYQKGVDELVFFDPNYGAFRYSREDLNLCFQHLFWTPALPVDDKVFDGDKAVYLRRKEEEKDHPVRGPWNKMGYTIFEKGVAENAA
jgi:Yersinia/Haemophilus virulence surface antigen